MKVYEFDCPECGHVITIAPKALAGNPRVTCPNCEGTINFDVKKMKRAVGHDILPKHKSDSGNVETATETPSSNESVE